MGRVATNPDVMWCANDWEQQCQIISIQYGCDLSWWKHRKLAYVIRILLAVARFECQIQFGPWIESDLANQNCDSTKDSITGQSLMERIFLKYLSHCTNLFGCKLWSVPRVDHDIKVDVQDASRGHRRWRKQADMQISIQLNPVARFKPSSRSSTSNSNHKALRLVR